MSRTVVKGLGYTYFTLDFFQDRKIRRLQRKYGPESPLVYLALLSLIYREGYYIHYDEDIALDLADITRLEESYVVDVINGCLEIDLLSKDMFSKHRILTSHGIQKNYNTVCDRAKRKASVEKYSLLAPEDKNNPSEDKNKSSEDKNLDSESGTQIKENKSNRNKMKENYSYSSYEEEKEEVLSFCFFQNWVSPNEEVKKIIAFNNMGGRCWERMSRVEKESALTLWKQQPEQKPRFSEDFLSFWCDVYSRLRSLEAPYAIRMDALSDDIGWFEQAGCLVLKVSDRLRDFIERNMDFFKPLIRGFQQRRRLRDDLHYSIIQTNNN